MVAYIFSPLCGLYCREKSELLIQAKLRHPLYQESEKMSIMAESTIRNKHQEVEIKIRTH